MENGRLTAVEGTGGLEPPNVQNPRLGLKAYPFSLLSSPDTMDPDHRQWPEATSPVTCKSVTIKKTMRNPSNKMRSIDFWHSLTEGKVNQIN